MAAHAFELTSEPPRAGLATFNRTNTHERFTDMLDDQLLYWMGRVLQVMETPDAAQEEIVAICSDNIELAAAQHRDIDPGFAITLLGEQKAAWLQQAKKRGQKGRAGEYPAKLDGSPCYGEVCSDTF